MKNITWKDPLIVLSDGKDRAQWLEARRVPGLVTATQCATIVGSHPYTKLVELWNEKTDPEWEGEERNRFLDVRAALGNDREEHIIAEAAERPELGTGKLYPNKQLIARADNPKYACTPDAAKYRRGQDQPIVVDAKTTQQNWNRVGGIGKPVGVPQHVTDQMLWTYMVTDAAEVWLAVEQYEWPKGKPPVLVDTHLIFVPFDQVRLDYILKAVERFEGWVRDAIAPESDIEVLEGFEVEFDDDAETIERKAAELAAAEKFDGLLTELAERRERIADDLAAIKALEDRIKALPKEYDGRRVRLIGTRMVAELIRGTRKVVDDNLIDPAQLRAATTYVESETVKITPNPEYVAPVLAAVETEQEAI
jgi:hypothetical protein